MTTSYPYTVCYRCSIITESVSPAVCEILSPKQFGATTHVKSLITWQFDSPYAVSYWCSIETEPLSPSVRKLFDSKYIWVTTLTFQGHVTSSITWRFDSPMGFRIGAPLEPSPYLQAFSRYLAPNISRSRPWPFGVTWRHWSCVYLMPHIAFPIGVPL